MANSLHHKHALNILNKFIKCLEDTGSITGFSYSFSKRKIHIERLSSGNGVIIKKDALYLHSELYENNIKLMRYYTEEEMFQAMCNNEAICDEELEDAITKAFRLHQMYLEDELHIGGWKRYE